LRSPAFTRRSYAVLARLSPGYPPQLGTFRCITHPFATRHQGCPRAAVRLACVRHAASVQSEPGSNSSVRFCVLDYSRWNPRSSRRCRRMVLVLPCVSAIALSLPATRHVVRPARAGCAFIERPHLSAVSFLKSRLLRKRRALYCSAARAAKKRNYDGRPR
jgi:hypothetical protein